MSESSVEQPTPDEQLTPVSKNWLKDITTSEVDKKRIFDTAFKCREDILTKHFGEPLQPEYVFKIKKQLEEKASIRELLGDSRESYSLILWGPGSQPNEFFTVSPTIYKEDNKPSRSEVRVYRHFVREAKEIDPSDPDHFTVHEYPYITNDEIGSIWLGETGKNDLPRVNVDNPPCSCSIEEQRAFVEGLPEPRPIHVRILDDMDREYLELCASQGITPDDLSSIEKMKFPDPHNPGGTLYGFMLRMQFRSSDRTLRNNYDDIYALSIIEKALSENKSGKDHKDYINYNSAILENTRHSHLDFSQPCQESSLTESEILKTVVFALVDINQIYPDSINRVANLGYNLTSKNAEEIGQQEKNILKSLSQIILPHCYEMNYKSESKVKTQPKYRIDFGFLKDGKAIKQINSLIFFRGRKLSIFS